MLHQSCNNNKAIRKSQIFIDQFSQVIRKLENTLPPGKDDVPFQPARPVFLQLVAGQMQVEECSATLNGVTMATFHHESKIQLCV